MLATRHAHRPALRSKRPSPQHDIASADIVAAHLLGMAAAAALVVTLTVALAQTIRLLAAG